MMLGVEVVLGAKMAMTRTVSMREMLFITSIFEVILISSLIDSVYIYN